MDVFREIADALLTSRTITSTARSSFSCSLEEAASRFRRPATPSSFSPAPRSTREQASLPVVVLFVVLATLLGSSILYWISRLGGMPVLCVSPVSPICQGANRKTGVGCAAIAGPHRLWPSDARPAHDHDDSRRHFPGRLRRLPRLHRHLCDHLGRCIYIFLGVSITPSIVTSPITSSGRAPRRSLLLAFVIAAAIVAFRRWRASRQRDRLPAETCVLVRRRLFALPL